MDITRRHLFARTCGAGQHDAAIGFRDLVQLRQQRPEGRRSPHHIGRGHIPPPQFLILAAQPRCFHRATDHNKQLINIKGLFDKVIRPLLDRRHGDFNIPVA